MKPNTWDNAIKVFPWCCWHQNKRKCWKKCSVFSVKCYKKKHVTITKTFKTGCRRIVTICINKTAFWLCAFSGMSRLKGWCVSWWQYLWLVQISPCFEAGFSLCVNSLLNSVAYIILFCLLCTGCSTVTRSQSCPRDCLMDWFPCSYCKYCLCVSFRIISFFVCVCVCVFSLYLCKTISVSVVPTDNNDITRKKKR